MQPPGATCTALTASYDDEPLADWQLEEYAKGLGLLRLIDDDEINGLEATPTVQHVPATLGVHSFCVVLMHSMLHQKLDLCVALDRMAISPQRVKADLGLLSLKLQKLKTHLQHTELIRQELRASLHGIQLLLAISEQNRFDRIFSVKELYVLQFLVEAGFFLCHQANFNERISMRFALKEALLPVLSQFKREVQMIDERYLADLCKLKNTLFMVSQRDVLIPAVKTLTPQERGRLSLLLITGGIPQPNSTHNESIICEIMQHVSCYDEPIRSQVCAIFNAALL